MRSLFSDVPDAVDNTAVIAEKCNFDFEFGNTKLPFYETPNGMDHFEYFKKCCYDGFYNDTTIRPRNMLTDWNMSFQLLKKWAIRITIL